MEKIKIAQIGVSHEHALGKINTLRMMSDVYEIVGVVDDSATKAAKFAGSLEPYKGLQIMSEEEVFQYPGLQGVVVEVPNTDLVPTAIRCMEHNLPMHLDKPAGEDLALFKKLLDACQTKKLPLQMGYMFRGNPAFQFCRKAVGEKWLGEIFEIEADMNHCYGGEPYQDYLCNFKGGIMFNLGCHLIDFIVAMMGAPEKVVPFLKSTPETNAKNNCLAVLEYPYATAIVRCCSKGFLEQRRLKIAGTEGWIELIPLERFDGEPLRMTMSLTNGNAEYPAGVHSVEFAARKDRYLEQMEELAEMIRGKIRNPYSYEHDYLVQKTVLAAAGYLNGGKKCMQ